MVLKGLPSTMNDEYQLNLHKILQHAAKVHDEVEVVSYRTLQNGGVHTFNYRQIYDRVCAMANALEALGVKPGDRIAILGWNDHRYFESYFSVSGIGAVLVQLNLTLDCISMSSHTLQTILLPEFCFLTILSLN